jgi:hypothetical protein
LDAFADEIDVIGAGRRNLGVEDKEFKDCMDEFTSKVSYTKMCVKLEVFSFKLDPLLTFCQCVLAFIKDMHELKNSDGSRRYGSGACRTAFSIFRKLGLFCHGIPSLKAACPQVEVLLKTWAKNENEATKATPFTEDEVERIFHLIPTSTTIHMIVSFCQCIFTIRYCFPKMYS